MKVSLIKNGENRKMFLFAYDMEASTKKCMIRAKNQRIINVLFTVWAPYDNEFINGFYGLLVEEPDEEIHWPICE